MLFLHFLKGMTVLIYVTGDTHGDYEAMFERKLSKLKKGDKLIITGDFGFIWDNSKEEIKNLAKLSKKKFDILFVEGTHENFDRINEFKEVDLFCGKGYKIDHNIYCLKRGEVYLIEHKTLLALGGGYSEYLSNEENEKAMPTDEQLKATVDNIQKEGRRIDIIITHEAPASVKRLIDRNASINDLNIFLDTVQHNTIYKKWFFGSLHVDRIVSEKLISVWQEVYKIDF